MEEKEPLIPAGTRMMPDCAARAAWNENVDEAAGRTRGRKRRGITPKDANETPMRRQQKRLPFEAGVPIAAVAG
jgi:hypothetical protein